MDIAEAGGLSKDGSPRPSKSQQGHAEQPGAQAHPGAMRQVGLDVVTNNRSEFRPVIYTLLQSGSGHCYSALDHRF